MSHFSKMEIKLCKHGTLIILVLIYKNTSVFYSGLLTSLSDLNLHLVNPLWYALSSSPCNWVECNPSQVVTEDQPHAWSPGMSHMIGIKLAWKIILLSVILRHVFSIQYYHWKTKTEYRQYRLYFTASIMLVTPQIPAILSLPFLW